MSTLVPGTVLQDRYEIIGPVGQGGMGAVYEAVQGRLKRRVAVKQLLIFGETRRSRAFLREAQILANLEHRALPAIIDYFTDDAGHFLVMDFIPGNDLAVQLGQRRAPFSVELVMQWADEVLDVLQYLHTQHPEPIFHGDIKPHNLKLRPNGAIMLLDFGLAKGYLAEMTHVAAESSIVGYTPGYSPPEQVDGTGTDGRSDLYALGATLHQLLTFTHPVDERSRWRAVGRGRQDPLHPVHELNPLVPEEVSAVLVQALALERDERPASAAVMRAALKAACHSLDAGSGSVAVPNLPLANAPDNQAASEDSPALDGHLADDQRGDADAGSSAALPDAQLTDTPVHIAPAPAFAPDATHPQSTTPPAVSPEQVVEAEPMLFGAHEHTAPRDDSALADDSGAHDQITEQHESGASLPPSAGSSAEIAAAADNGKAASQIPISDLPSTPQQAPALPAVEPPRQSSGMPSAAAHDPSSDPPADETLADVVHTATAAPETPLKLPPMGSEAPEADAVQSSRSEHLASAPLLPVVATQPPEPASPRSSAGATKHGSVVLDTPEEARGQANAASQPMVQPPAPAPAKPSAKRMRYWVVLGLAVLLVLLVLFIPRSPLVSIFAASMAPSAQASVEPSVAPTTQASVEPSVAPTTQASATAEPATAVPAPSAAVAASICDGDQVEAETDNAEEHFQRGNAALAAAQYNQAIGEYSRVIELEPGYVDAYISRGQAFHMEEKYDCAIDDYTQALEIDPQSVVAYMFRGNAYAKQEDQRPIRNYASAIEDYTQSIELSQQQNLVYGAAYLNRAWVRFNVQQYDLSIDDYSRALELEADDTKKIIIFYGRGQAYYAKQQYDLAISDLDQAIARDQNYAEAYLKRGLAYKGKYGQITNQQANADFRKVLEISDNPVLRQQAENELVLRPPHWSDPGIRNPPPLIEPQPTQP